MGRSPRHWAAIIALLCLALASSPARPQGEFALFLPTVQVHRDLRHPPVRLNALFYDGYAAADADEAFHLWNPGPDTVDLVNWAASDGSKRVVFPPLLLPPRETLWCAYSAVAFQAAFGFPPACEYGPVTDPSLPHLDGAPFHLGDDGGRLSLTDPQGIVIDALVYENGPATLGWTGPGVFPWHPYGFAEGGQILSRKTDEATGEPLPDTDRADDWASDPADPIAGRKVRYPAWDTTAFKPLRAPDPALVTVALTPDSGFAVVRDALQAAQTSIQLELYTFDHPGLADVVAARAAAGVSVTVLLEGAPAGGLADADRWAASRVAQAGGRVLFMSSARGGRPRYRSQHAKFAVLDGRRLLLLSENFSPQSLPSDDFSDGTLGQRGVVLLTEQPALVAHAAALFARDTNLRWRDLVAWNPCDTVYGPPPPGYVPPAATGGAGYAILAPLPLIAWADDFELAQSPENSLRRRDGLRGLLARAGAGDTVLVEQLQEPPWWGVVSASPAADPNPRLDAYLAAARRGTTVRLLLDSFFDQPGEPRANRATCIYVNEVAVAEALDLQCRTGNPTRLGIHNKLVLARVGGQGYVHLGSLNGSEVSHKLNRELALQFRSRPVYDYLAWVWTWDWDHPR